MAVTPNSAVRPQSSRRVSAVLTAAKTTYADNANAVKLCDVGPNGLSWLIKLTAVPRATVTATQLMLFWSPDNGTTMYLVTTVLMGAYTLSTTTQIPETDFGLTSTSPRELAPAGSSFWVGASVALAAGIVVNAEVEDA